MQVVRPERGRTAGGRHVLAVGCARQPGGAEPPQPRRLRHRRVRAGRNAAGGEATHRGLGRHRLRDRGTGTDRYDVRGAVRHASTGGHTLVNTHPFEQRGRLFAHNGVVEGLDRLDARLAELGVADLVLGETDSERVFALLTAEIAGHGDDVGAGVCAAIGWIAEQLAVYSVNFVLATATDLWALRYPAANELWLLPRRAGGTAGRGALDARTDRIHVGSAALLRRARREESTCRS